MKNLSETKNIILENGLSVISKDQLKRKFIFENRKTSHEIEIIEIGKTALDLKRHIHQLTKNTISNSCGIENVKVITFFVGTQIEFDTWENTKISELQTLETKGIDWCKFYKTELKK